MNPFFFLYDIVAHNMQLSFSLSLSLSHTHTHTHTHTQTGCVFSLSISNFLLLTHTMTFFTNSLTQMSFIPAGCSRGISTCEENISATSKPRFSGETKTVGKSSHLGALVRWTEHSSALGSGISIVVFLRGQAWYLDLRVGTRRSS